MKVIGLTGSVGSGKSTVAHLLEQEYGAKLLIADDIGYALSQKGQSCFEQIVELFSHEYGSEVLDGTGELNRKKIAEIVFEKKEYLERLNGIVHPAVKENIKEQLGKYRAAGEKLAVIESAIIIGAGYEDICDEFVLVTVPYELQKQRLMENRGYTEEKIQDILRNQLPEEKMKKYCNHVVVNDQDLEKIKKQLDFLLV